MQHIIEIRQKDLTELKLIRLNQFIENGREKDSFLKKTQVTSAIDLTDIPGTVRRIMSLPWNIVNITSFDHIDKTITDVSVRVSMLVDEAGHRFIAVLTKPNNMPNTIGSIYIGYDADLTSVNQMFTVTRIKSDEWRYC